MAALLRADYYGWFPAEPEKDALTPRTGRPIFQRTDSANRFAEIPLHHPRSFCTGGLPHL